VQLSTLLVESLKSGSITISEKDVPQLEIKVRNKKIDINATNKEFIKDLVNGAEHSRGIKERLQRSAHEIKVVRETRPLVKDIVEDLRKEGVTLTLSYKGDKVATIGSEANSKLTQIVTGTKGIEINSPRKLVELGISTLG
jgi:fructose-1,6-bisphosphatase/sedoheptulose 1,7-bisphosphatase-like protein